jgi:hypothetical protein
MRMHHVLAPIALYGIALAQSPLTTTFASNNGQSGNMFDLVATNAQGITVDYFDVNLDSGTWNMEVYKLTNNGPYLPSVNTPGDWTLIGSTDVTSNGPDVPTQLRIPVCTFVPAGATQAFYVTVTNGTAINYTSGTATGALFASNADLEFYEGSGLAYPFQFNFNPRVWNGNIHYLVGDTSAQCTAFASATPYGQGCYEAAASYYEVMDALGMDLGGLAVTATGNGSGFDVASAAASIQPIGGGAVALTLGDDDQIDTATVGGTLGLHVGSNCWVAYGGGNSTGFEPTVATFLANPDTAVYAWTDLQPNAAGSGQVWYEESGTVATVTYDGVFGWNTTEPNTVQFTIDTATGDHTIAFGALSTSNPEDWLIGYSPGGASLDGGPTDLSAGAFAVPATDTAPLALDSTAPGLGAIWQLTASNIDPAASVAVFAVGDTELPGFNLAPFGGPDCFVYNNLNLALYTAPASSGTSKIEFVLPNQTIFLGAEAFAQASAPTTLNAIGFVTSNGMRCKAGL